jgi:hypothetical protein
VFDGLLPEPHNQTIAELLFVMAHWHAMAKLRMHNDLTLAVMDAVTVSLGKKLRAFTENTCPAFATKELHKEYNARLRREAKKAASNASNNHATYGSETIGVAQTTLNPQATTLPTVTHTGRPYGTSGRRAKTLNLNTFKGHSLGDYSNTIRMYGTSDSYSTEPVCDQFSPSTTTDLVALGRTGASYTEV